ncbi:MAG: type II secretion system F family protein [Brevibacterium yomogidense]
MTIGLLVLLAAAVLLLATVGASSYLLGTWEKRAIVHRERSLLRRVGVRAAVFEPMDRLLARLVPVQRLRTLMVQANVRSIRVSEFLTGAFVLAVVVALSLGQIMAWHWAIILGLTVIAGLIYGLTLRYQRQREQIIAQLPEFARILASTTGAGLSVQTALAIAGDELADPAGREIAHMSRELDLGTPLDAAFERLQERIPGRDLSVLVSTLVISHRSGGSLITALRDLSFTLEERKETAREVRTLVAESSYTGYMVAGMGIVLLCLLMFMNDQVLHNMTSTIVGQIALVIAGVGYAVGIVLINRMTRVKL